MQTANTPDLENMTDAERGAYYDEHADEIRAAHGAAVDSGDVVEFAPSQDASMVLSVRIKGDEIRTLLKAAHDAGLPTSTYVRQVALAAATGATPQTHLSQKAALEVVKDLSIGDIAAQLANGPKTPRRGVWKVSRATAGGLKGRTTRTRSEAVKTARKTVSTDATGKTKAKRPPVG